MTIGRESIHKEVMMIVKMQMLRVVMLRTVIFTSIGVGIVRASLYQPTHLSTALNQPIHDYGSQQAGFGYPSQNAYPEGGHRSQLAYGTNGWPQQAYVPSSPSAMFPQPMMPPPPRPAPPPPPTKQTAEARLAWLEYLANAYIQCDDLKHAAQMQREMFLWLVRYPRLRREISEAVQIIQQRIDERKDCICKKKGGCGRHAASSKTTMKGDMTGPAEQNMYKIMGRMHDDGNIDLDKSEEKSLDRIHMILSQGFVSSAIKAFQHVTSSNPAILDTKAYGKLDFVMRLVRFDLENPDNCMPLWKTDCNLRWRTKLKILETFDAIRALPASHKSLRQALYRIADLPNRDEIRTRLMVAVGRAGAWKRVKDLDRPIRYLAEACLTLHGAPRPEQFTDAPSWEFHLNPLDARAQARLIYERCLNDRRLPPEATARCRDAITQIGALEKTCPFGGFVRIGIFSQVFGDYLFIKCLAPPVPPPSYFLPPKQPVMPPNPDRWKLRRVARLLHKLRDHVEEIGERHHPYLYDDRESYDNNHYNDESDEDHVNDHERRPSRRGRHLLSQLERLLG